MTVIAWAVNADGDAYMAADAQWTAGDGHLGFAAKPKVFQVGKYTFAHAGRCGDGDCIEYTRNKPPPVPPTCKDKLQFMSTIFRDWISNVVSDNDEDTTWLVAHGSQLYEYMGNATTLIQVTDDYYAIGSGGSYALGAMWALGSVGEGGDSRRTVTYGVGAGKEMSALCGGMTTVLKVG
jgi:ATP-dependent protease HslVU (ClpYQ) peptidase subunit